MGTPPQLDLVPTQRETALERPAKNGLIPMSDTTARLKPGTTRLRSSVCPIYENCCGPAELGTETLANTRSKRYGRK